MILLVILVPFVLGAAAFAWPDNRTRPALLLVGAVVHLAWASPRSGSTPRGR